MDTKDVLDFLGGLDKRKLVALQVAALLGSTFSLDHIIEISDMKASELLAFFDEMIKQDIIKEKSGNGRGIYCFRQQKVSKIVLRSMDIEKKELYLSNIISYLERDLPNDDKKPIILAELFLKFKFESDKDCFQHMKKAADLLSSAHKTEEALDLYKEIIDRLLTKNRDSLESILLIDSIISYVPIAINLQPPNKILPIVETALSLADDLQNNRVSAMLELCLGRLYQCQGKNRKASSHYDKGWNIAQETEDEGLMRTTSKLFALSLFWQGRISDAIRMYERTLGNVEEISSDLRDLWAYLMLGYCYGITGRVARGLGLIEAIQERAVSKKYLKTQAFTHSVIAIILLEVRRMRDAEPHINEALKIGKKIGSELALWMAEGCKAYLMFCQGNFKEAKELLESAVFHSTNLGQSHHPSPFLIEILWSLHKAKRISIGGYSFTSEIERLMDWPDIYMKGVALRYRALEKKISGAEFKEVERLLEESQELLKEAGAQIELGRTQVELAKLLVENKERARAEEFARTAYGILSEINSSLFPSELLFLIETRSKENRIFHGISELSNAINSLPDSNSYLGEVVTILTDMFGAERAAILLQDDTANESFSVAATRNFNPEELQQFSKGHLKNLLVSAIEDKRPLIITNTDKDPIQESLYNLPVKSFACIPLIIDSRVIGVIYTDNRLLEGIFSKNDLVIMTAIASQVALSLKATTLHRELKDLRENMSRGDFHQAAISENSGFPRIIGKSGAIRRVLVKAKKVSGTEATVLILGETGVGKELLARAIHQLSHRKEKLFITINVSALTENLLTTELFGYEKGAFTSAEKSKVGRFEMADGGTIFLDEIGDLSMEAQVKLLRVLQEGEFERVGGTRTIRSDFRLIAATNKDLRQMVAKGEFRSDLFYRINTFPIEIPPLREREEDIPDIAMHFMRRYARKNRKNLLSISNHELKKLLGYAWPGNIRELEHIIERAVILSEGKVFEITDFEIERPSPAEEDGGKMELLPLEDIDRGYIIKVLNHTKWRIRGERGAAKILGLKPSTLEFRIKKLGIRK